MGATFTASDADLEQLERALGSSMALLADVSANLAEESINLVREGFEATRSPAGVVWQATKRGNKALHGPSGALRTSWNVRHSGPRGFSIAAGVAYAAIHQGGAPRAGIVARPMVPADDDVPPVWRDRFDEVTDDIIEARLR
jgi:phage gpG-like protein